MAAFKASKSEISLSLSFFLTHTHTHTHTRHRGTISVRTAGLICSVIGFLVYINALDCGLCFDDLSAIVENPDLR